MKALVVDRALSAAELEEVRNFDGPVFSTDSSFAPNITSQELFLSAEQTSALTTEVWEYIRNFPNSTIGQKFMAKISHENFYMWYCLRFRMYNQLKQDYLFYQSLKPLLVEHAAIQLYSNIDDAWQLFTDGSVEIEVVKAPAENAGTGKQAKKAFVKKFVKRALGQAFNGSALNKPKHLILANNRHYQPLVDLKTLKTRKGNPYLEYLFDTAGDDICILEYPIFPAQNDSIEMVNDTRMEGYGGKASVCRQDWIMLRGMMSMGFWSTYRGLKKQWSADMTSIMSRCTNPMDKIVLHRALQWRSIGYLCLIYFLTTSRWVKRKRNNILSVAAIGESNSEIRSMFEGFRKHSVPTVAIMHGAVHSANLHYSYAKEELKFKPFPDYFCVWGAFWKEQIQQFTGIEESRLISTGQIRTDIIPKLLEQAKGKTSDRLKIVFASQPFRDMAMRVRAAETVFRAIAKLPHDKIEFTLKPHPGETSDEFFTEIAEREGLKALTVSRNKDLYEQLAECDVLMTCYSTVGAEAVYFGKAVVTIDFDGSDLAGYVKEGVATAVSNANELKALLNNILQEGVSIDSAARAQFIANYAHKINGKASERTLDALRAVGNKV